MLYADRSLTETAPQADAQRGGVASNPFAVADGRGQRPRRAPNPFAPQRTAAMGGPNPMAMNQSGLAPQGQRDVNPGIGSAPRWGQAPHAPSSGYAGPAQGFGGSAAAPVAAPTPTLYAAQPANDTMPGPEAFQPGTPAATATPAPAAAPTAAGSEQGAVMPGGNPITTTVPGSVNPSQQQPAVPGPATNGWPWPYRGQLFFGAQSGKAPTGQRTASNAALDQFGNSLGRGVPLTTANGQPDWGQYVNAASQVAGASFANSSGSAADFARTNADMSRLQSQPFQQTAMNRLGAFYTNQTLPSLGAFNAVTPNIATDAGGLTTGTSRMQGGNAMLDAAAQNVAGGLGGTPLSSRVLGNLGNVLTGRYGTGAVDPTAGASGLYGSLAQGAAGSAASAPTVADAGLSLGDTLMGRLGSGQVDTGSGDVGAYGAMARQAAQGLASSPDRLSLAQNAVSALNAADDIGLDRRLKQIREQQAADGRLGLAADTQVNDLLRSVSADRAARNAVMANDIASGSVSDAAQRASALAGLQGQAYGQAAGNADRAFQRGAAAYGLGGNLAGSSASNLLNQASTFGGLQNTAFGQGQQNADNAFARSRAALADAQGIAGADYGQATGNLGALSGYTNTLAQQAGTAFNQAQAERQAQLAYQQQGIQNALTNNMQNWQQLVQAFQLGNPYAQQDTYNNLAALEAGRDANIQARDAQLYQGLGQGLGQLGNAFWSLYNQNNPNPNGGR